MADSFAPETTDSFVEDSFVPDKTPARKRKPNELGGPEKTDPKQDSWGERFGTGMTGALLTNPVGGVRQFAQDPIGALKGIPAGLKAIFTGEPEAIGGLVGNAPYSLIGGRALPASTGPVLRGAAKGAWDGATAPTSLPLKIRGLPIEIGSVPASVAGAVAGATAGKFLPLVGGTTSEILGGAIGAATPAVRGAVRGAKAGLQDYRTSQLPPRVSLPQRAGISNPTPAVVPEFSGTPGQLPSGRVPGPAPQAPPSSLPPRVSLPDQVGIQPTARPVSEFSGTPGALPSGRKIGPTPVVEAPPPVARTPLWNDLPTPSNTPPMEFSPTSPGGLPSGRKVGAFGLEQIEKPAPPRTVLPDAVVLNPKEGLSPYLGKAAEGAEIHAAAQLAMDTDIAKMLYENQITPEIFRASQDKWKGWATAVRPKYKLGIKRPDLVESHLRKAWGQSESALPPQVNPGDIQ